MPSFMKYGLMSACLLAQTMPAAAQVDVDHDGNGRTISVQNHASHTSITSRGNGGVLHASISRSSDVRIYHLGGTSEAYVDAYDTAKTDVFIGHCPDGMTPEAIGIEHAEGELIIPRCQ